MCKEIDWFCLILGAWKNWTKHGWLFATHSEWIEKVSVCIENRHKIGMCKLEFDFKSDFQKKNWNSCGKLANVYFLISIIFCRYVLLSQPLRFLHKQLTFFLFLLTLEQFKIKHSILEVNISVQYFTKLFKTL